VDPFLQLEYPFAQRAALELLLLCGVAAALGPWIVLRGLAFFAHAVGTAAFPGLIAADALGITPQIGAAAGAAIVSSGAGVIHPRGRDGSRTALWLTGALAVGAILASDVTHSGAGVEAALFGSLFATSTVDIALAATAAVLGAIGALTAGPRWLASGLTGRSVGHWDSLLLALVALAAIAQLAAAGALLASALLVLPAVAARPWCKRLHHWQALTAVGATVVSASGLMLALYLDVPPGATIAVIAGLLVPISYLLDAARKRAPQAKLMATAVSGIVLLAVAGCGGSAKPGEVVATTPIAGDLASTIAGPDLTVRTMIPAGVDPHDYEPRPSDIVALAEARLMVTSGSGIDSWAAGLLDRSGGSAPILDLARATPIKLPGDSPGTNDPHWFHDPRNAAAAAEALARQFASLDPAHATNYRARAKRFSDQAMRLDQAGRACIARLTPSQRTLVTDHDAFAYLVSRLNLRLAGTVIPAQSSTAAPSARDLDRLASRIRDLHVRAIFPERALAPKLANALAAQTGADASTQLDGDTLGPKGTTSASWAGMWASNVNRIAAALSDQNIQCHLRATR